MEKKKIIMIIIAALIIVAIAIAFILGNSSDKKKPEEEKKDGKTMLLMEWTPDGKEYNIKLDKGDIKIFKKDGTLYKTLAYVDSSYEYWWSGGNEETLDFYLDFSKDNGNSCLVYVYRWEADKLETHNGECLPEFPK